MNKMSKEALRIYNANPLKIGRPLIAKFLFLHSLIQVL